MIELTEREKRMWGSMFDFYRRAYEHMGFSAHQQFYNTVYLTFPEQKKYHIESVIDALTYAMSTRPAPIKVWELGGWRGELAAEAIPQCGNGIAEWRNNEICPAAVVGSLRGLAAYVCRPMKRWAWDETDLLKGYDIAIMSHVIEHLSGEHLQSLLLMLRQTPFLYFETPDAMNGDDSPRTAWYNTLSTHKLLMGWRQINKLLGKLGYEQEWQCGQARLYAKIRSGTHD